MKITKAVITAAGYGTRFLPVTKTIQKEMLPILSKPLVDYVVDDCIKAGIQEIIFIVKKGDEQLRHYYSEDRELYNYFEKMQKLDKYQLVENLHTKAKFTFVEQPIEAVYGSATPVKLAKELVENEAAFLVFMGDDFIFNTDGSSEAAKMMELFQMSNVLGLATFYPRPADLLNKYGVAEYFERNGQKYLKSIVEKPDPSKAPSNLANISKYIFTPEIFRILESQQVNEQYGELFLTDTITELTKKGDVVIYSNSGEYLDGGYVLGWLEANLTLAMHDPELRSSLEEFLKKKFFPELLSK